MNPIEAFFISYLEQNDTSWEKIEDQVYDALFPKFLRERLTPHSTREIERFSFDPEALADYPEANLLHLGNPALDHIFLHAQEKGRRARIFLVETNLSPFQLNYQVQKDLKIPKKVCLDLGTPRILNFPMVLFRFQATYLCDEKQQSILSVGIDCYSKRVLRHLESWLETELFTETPSLPYPNASAISVFQAYMIAQKECAYKAKTSATLLRQNLTELFSKESKRLQKYFSEMEQELREKREKGDNPEKNSQQLESILLEKKLRLLDLEKKMHLKSQIELCQLLEINQLKFFIPATIKTDLVEINLPIIWNPKLNKTEPLSCPHCHTSTFILEEVKNRIRCPHCVHE